MRKKEVSEGYAGELPSKTLSVCPECLKIIPALIFEERGKVWIKKSCDKHGEFRDLYWGSAEMYRKAKKFSYDGKGVSNPNIDKDNPNCPKDCGLCKMHKSHTALANLVITNRCDLSCWYCFYFAKKAGYIYEPTMKELEMAVDLLVNEKPVPGNAIQLTGGNPELREDVVDIIKMVKSKGVDHVQLNINGTHKFWNDPEWAKKVREAGVNTVYLSFDGVTPKTNPKNHWEVPFMLENARKAGQMGIILVPTVIKSVNDHEVGDILRFGFKNKDVVRGVNFQPVSLVGRMPKKEREKFRITIPDTIERIEQQTNGQVTADDFYPVPSMGAITRFVQAVIKKPSYSLSTHFACGMATYIFDNDGKMLPAPQFVDMEGLFEYLNEKAEELEKGKSRYVVGTKLLFSLKSFIDNKKAPKGFSLAKLLYNVLVKHDYRSLGVLQHNSMFVGMMHFMDKFNFDIERVKRCCIHYLTPEAIIPFCTFNVIPEWYRDRFQDKYAISFKEWEKKSGKKMDADLYKRDIKKLTNSPVYKKTYEGFL